MRTILTMVAMMFCLARGVYAQEIPADTAKVQLYVVTKNDGTEYIGKILSDDGREVLLMTETLGKIYIPKSDIRSIIKIEDKKDIVYGEFRNTGPFTTRYVFTTNALPITKGENYALINLYGPEVHFAVSNNFNIGIMSTWIASPMLLALKYSIKTKNERLNFSLGTLLGTSGYLNTFRGFGGMHFANITFGDRKNNLTFSAGYCYLQDGFYTNFSEAGTYYNDNSWGPGSNTHVGPIDHGPVLSVAGITSVGAKASFVFDSMFGLINTKSNNVITTTITPESYYYNPNPPYDYTYVPGYYRHDVSVIQRQSIAMFLMPGMRFQTKENHAFQVSLAGVALFRTKGYSNYNKTTSFPFPMCTWFFRF